MTVIDYKKWPVVGERWLTIENLTWGDWWLGSMGEGD